MVVAKGLQSDPQLHAGLAVDVDELVVLQLDDIAVVAAGFGQVGGVEQRCGAQDTLKYAAGVLKGFKGKRRMFSFIAIKSTSKIIANLSA